MLVRQQMHLLKHAAVGKLQTALNARTVEVTKGVAERQSVEQIDRNLTQRVATLEQANLVLDQSNRSEEANAEDARERAQHASAFLVGAIRRNVEAQGTAVVDPLENVAQTVEGLVATIERAREMNVG